MVATAMCTLPKVLKQDFAINATGHGVLVTYDHQGNQLKFEQKEECKEGTCQSPAQWFFFLLRDLYRNEADSENTQRILIAMFTGRITWSDIRKGLLACAKEFDVTIDGTPSCLEEFEALLNDDAG